MALIMKDKKLVEAMKEKMRKKKHLNSSSSSHSYSFFTLFYALLCIALFFMVAFSIFHIFGVSFKPELSSTWKSPEIRSQSTEQPLSVQSSPIHPAINIRQAISLPDLTLLFINDSSNLIANSNIQCLYYTHSSSAPAVESPLKYSFNNNSSIQCPPVQHNLSISLSLSSSCSLPPVEPLRWDHLAYSAVLDSHDNTTLVYAKGLNLRANRLSDPNRFECVFGWHFENPKYQLHSPVVSAAQEIFRCKTPLSVLNRINVNPPLVSVKTRGRGSFTLPTIARTEMISTPRREKYKMCVCTMVYNQARFIPEWIAYHSKIGVEKWFIYDNNSDDNIEDVVSSMTSVSLHEWPWIKTQEAGFAHCALRARDSCEWVGFIDVDEFLYLPCNLTLHAMLNNYSNDPSIGELRTDCHTFGPSGKEKMPPEGVILGYICRMAAPERHKSIIRPEALNPSLINIVHHFHLKDGMKFVNIENRAMIINHYKYQVWEVFQAKFLRRVATYVADWKDEENVGSKDRAPGLGTKAIKPSDWSTRFCEVNDTGLSDWVMKVFTNRNTGLLPW